MSFTLTGRIAHRDELNVPILTELVCDRVGI